MSLIIKNLEASAEGAIILKGINLEIPRGKISVLMGPNASGKSTLANIIMGNPKYKIEGGKIEFDGKNLVALRTWQRARLGLFLSFQNPYEIPGLNIYEFLLAAYKNMRGGIQDFDEKLKKALDDLGLTEKFLERNVNEGFSGGEKKKAEILQLKILRPRLAILDEIDSGLDIDALKLIAKNLNKLVSPKLGLFVITHYQRLLNYLKPDHVHIMINGRITHSGGSGLVHEIEKKGYSHFKK